MTDRPQSDSDEFLEVIREMRGRYISSFAEQVQGLRALSAGDPSDADLETLRTTVHRLAGLSGTLGFPTAGAGAVELERMIESAVAFGGFDNAVALGMIDTIETAFSRDLASPPSWIASINP